MQIDRLFEIIYTLLWKKSTTAKELADKFGVSQRTIYRDIDTLSLAGIPVYTSRGKGGGIGLLDEFVLDKSVLNEKEQNEIMLALQSLRMVKPNETDQILRKLGAFWNRSAPNWLEVDLTDWSHWDNGYFNSIKSSILDKRIIKFEYYNASGEKSQRRIEPIQLWFKHRAWYLKGFCLGKEDVRIFKLTRIRNLQVTEDVFPERDLLNSVKSKKENGIQDVTFVFKIMSEMTYRVYDEFDDGQVTKDKDGNFIVTVTWPEDEWVYGFILSFGEYLEVIEPERVRSAVCHRLRKTLGNYT